MNNSKYAYHAWKKDKAGTAVRLSSSSPLRLRSVDSFTGFVLTQRMKLLLSRMARMPGGGCWRNAAALGRLFPLLSIILPLGLSGCASSPTTASASAAAVPPPSVAILVRAASGQPPTDAQSIVIQQTMSARLAQEGYRLATDPAASDYLLTISFTPAAPPSNGGRIQLVGLEKTASTRAFGGASAEAQEAAAMRRKLRDIDQWVEAQSRNRLGEGS